MHKSVLAAVIGVFWLWAGTAGAGSVPAANQPVPALRVDANGRTLKTLLADLEKQGGPRAYFQTEPGDEILRGQYSGADWSDLIRQLAANYNYYLLSDGDSGRLKEVFILERKTLNPPALNRPVIAEKAREPVPAICNQSETGAAVIDHGPRFAAIRQQICKEQ